MSARALRCLLGWSCLLGVAALAACARVRPLEGGPADEDPPRLVASAPADSATNISRWQRFELEFDEPVGSASARNAVRFEPYVRVGEVRVRGRYVTITPAESLPADTTVVLVLGKALMDLPQRGNKLEQETRLLFSTGSRVRAGAVRGRVTIKGEPNPKAAVQWEPVPADSSRGGLRRRLPVTSANPEGLFGLDGLPAGRRFVLRAFLDQNDNLFVDEGEIAAVYPETLQLALGTVRRGLSWNVIDPNEPAEVSGVAFNETSIRGPLAIALKDLETRPADSTRTALPESVAVRADTLRPLPLPVAAIADSLWRSAYARLGPQGFVKRDWRVLYASPRGDYSVRVPPGRHAWIAFVDVRRDSAPGYYVSADSSALAWEPLWAIDTLRCEPGAKVRLRSVEIRSP